MTNGINLIDPAAWSPVNGSPYRDLFRDMDEAQARMHSTFISEIAARLAVDGLPE